jgi:hypothetical protein
MLEALSSITHSFLFNKEEGEGKDNCKVEAMPLPFLL